MESNKIKISNDALVTANSLRNNNLQKRNLKEVITDIIKRISQELISAHREGSHHIITTVPITFSIPNMSNTDTQRYIYASVIDELISKDYRIWISPGKNICRIKITWMSPDDETEIKYQMQLIAKHTNKF
jgi:acid stress-induced BolA-like protein IbaG/YrbA